MGLIRLLYGNRVYAEVVLDSATRLYAFPLVGLEIRVPILVHVEMLS